MNRWFLPKSPDLLSLLSTQGALVTQGITAFDEWSHGKTDKAAEVYAAQSEAQEASRAVLVAVQHAFVTAINPEDIYELSERLDKILIGARNLVRETELLAMEPDAPMAEMADNVLLGVRKLVEAFPALSDAPDQATEAADAAVAQQRSIEHVYRTAMSALLGVHEIGERAGRRELYRRCAALGDAIEGVAHRIWYAVVKES
jgi:uncharacterized protein Yka (UPF0111/DUF47 family)